MGGKIKVASTLGRGSTFRVHLPAQVREAGLTGDPACTSGERVRQHGAGDRC
jgi:hypothetical protein